MAPSAEIHGSHGYTLPRALSAAEIETLPEAFAAAARRALAAGFDVAEIHAAHGYLLNQFLSPLANHRTDAWGGSLENRMRLPLAVVDAVRAVWPEDKPLFLRISATDAHPDGWTVEDSIVFARTAKARGVDVVDCSSGGFSGAAIKPGPAYQLPLADAVRRGADVATMTVGLITDPAEAEAAVAEERADLVALARAALDDPNWPQHARIALGGEGDAYADWPKQAGYAVRNKDKVLGKGGFSAVKLSDL